MLETATLEPEPSPVTVAAPPPARFATKLQRHLGSYGGYDPGPLVICVAGIHGNEPSGVVALQRVLAVLQDAQPAFRGQLVALAGNLAALSRGQRYIHRDLNRGWLQGRVQRLLTLGSPESIEDAEQSELVASIREILKGRQRPAIFLDLHTTSGPGPPFAISDDTLPNRRLALALPIPVLVGLEEKVYGTFIDFANSVGHIGISFEGGQHDSQASIEHHMAVILITLSTVGCINPRDVPEFEQLKRALADSARGLPHVLEVLYRRGVEHSDGFVMEPGFANFRMVKRGQVLGRDRHGEIATPVSGRLLLPLYQNQGSDAFFIGRPLYPIWLWASSLLRRMRVERWLHLLPGVERDTERPHVKIVDPRLVRRAGALFRLLGYRRKARAGNHLMVTRRADTPRRPY